MADKSNRNETNMGTTGATGARGDWSSEERFWRDNYRTRPYASADRGFEHYQPGYRYGFESASRQRGRSWDESESDLRSGWDRYEHRGDNRSTWDEIKDSVKDAWDRVTGGGDDAQRERAGHTTDTDRRRL